MKEGWGKYSLMDICNVTTGKHDANHAEVNGKYRFYTCSSQYVYCNTKRYEGECIILPGNGVNVGELYYFNGEFDAYQRTYVIDKIDKRIIPMFLYYHLQNNWKSEGVAKQYGSATNYIKIGNFKDYIVKIPQSLSEQQSIVDYLDTAFAKIDAMKANAEKALNEAKALFQASLKEMLEPKEGWKERKLGDVCSFSQGVQVPLQNQSLKELAGYTRFLRIIDFTQGNEPPRYVPISDAKYWMKHEDIAIVRYGASTGFICTGLEGTLANNLFRLNFKCEVLPRYLIYVLKSEIFQSVIKVQMNGAAMPAISFGLIDGIKIPLPSAKEQQAIITSLDSLKSKVDRLQENYNKISQECDALKQAILRQVFE